MFGSVSFIVVVIVVIIVIISVVLIVVELAIDVVTSVRSLNNSSWHDRMGVLLLLFFCFVFV